jgi:glutathione reductase (NADPH)
LSFDYDLFVIGGGSGGVRAARIAAAEGGARVGLAEESRMGGTCVIRGCVPKKLMVYASGFPDLFEEAGAYGWDMGSAAFDWTRFRTRLEAELTRLEGAYRNTLKNAGVVIHDARARMVDAHTVDVGGQTVTAKHVLIATGGRPFVPALPGIELAVTSNEMFHLDALPERALVAHGVDLRLNMDVARLERVQGGIRVVAEDGSVEVVDLVLYATGRKPNVEGLGLEALGVQVGAKGEIVVDEWSQTSVPSIFAVGDVTDRVNLTPVAIRQGHAFADTVFGANPRKVDHDLIPSAVFTQPELGAVGLTEQQAAKLGPVEIYSATFRPMRGAFAARPDKVLMKLVVSVETRKVLGCHIVGPEAGEMIQLAAIAVKMGATKEDFDRTVAVHPTMAEELVTMRKATRRS